MFLVTERRSTWRVPVLRAEAIHCRTSGRSIVRRLPARLIGGRCRPRRSAPVQVDVPEEVIAPALGRAMQPQAERERRQRLGTPRLAQELQPDLLGCVIALLAIARDAAGDDVVPTLVAAASDGDHVVERELGGSEPASAVLTTVIVPGVDVGPGEGDVGEGTFHPDVTEQAKHRRELDPYRDAADLPVVDGDDLHLALEEHGDGLLPRNDPQGLVGRVEHQGLFHGRRPKKLCARERLLSRRGSDPCDPEQAAPAVQAARTSVGVSAPGMTGTEYRRQISMVARLRAGLTTKRAPASMQARAVSASSTVPAPSRTSWPKRFETCSMTPSAPGTVIVISRTVTPPSRIASTTLIASSADGARTTRTRPISAIWARICCLVMSLISGGELSPHLARRELPP